MHTFLAVAMDLMTALDAAHRRGIVHRDIKPSNIFLATDADQAVGFSARLLDFGVSKVFAPEAARLPALEVTEETFVVGTPMTMSPEQARGQDVDARSDLYSAGVVLYEMLSDRLPFDAATGAELMLAHCREVPQAPSRHYEAHWVPPELVELVLQRANYTCETCARSREALERLGQKPHPAALIVDLMMPDLDGIAIIAGARRAGFKGPILLFTSVQSKSLQADVAADPTVTLCDKVDDLHRLAALLTKAGVQPRPALA